MKKIKITLEDVPKKSKYDKYPRFDINRYAFASPEDADKMQIDYIKQVRKVVIRRCLIIIILIALALFGLAIAGGYSVGAYASPYSTSSHAKHYILNKNTKKFHYTWCDSVKQMSPFNKKAVKWERKKAISHGYSPCGNCNP